MTSTPPEGWTSRLFRLRTETLHTIGLLTSTQAPPVQKAPPSGEMLAQELAIARDTRDKLARSVKTLFDEISKTGTPRPGPVNEAIQEITIVTRTLSTHATFMALSHGPQLDPSFNNHSLAVCTLTTIIGQTLGYDLMKLHELATGAPIA